MSSRQTKHKLRKNDVNDDNAKPAKEMKLMSKISTINYDKRLIVILVNASLETVKVGLMIVKKL